MYIKWIAENILHENIFHSAHQLTVLYYVCFHVKALDRFVYVPPEKRFNNNLFREIQIQSSCDEVSWQNPFLEVKPYMLLPLHMKLLRLLSSHCTIH